jgi:hypothetical protein
MVQKELSSLAEDRLTLKIPGSFASRIQTITYFQDSNGLIRQRTERTFFPHGANLADELL